MPILTPCADAGASAIKAHATMAADASWIILTSPIMFSSRFVLPHGRPQSSRPFAS
jgi:hypothetical protein